MAEDRAMRKHIDNLLDLVVEKNKRIKALESEIESLKALIAAMRERKSPG